MHETAPYLDATHKFPVRGDALLDGIPNICMHAGLACKGELGDSMSCLSMRRL